MRVTVKVSPFAPVAEDVEFVQCCEAAGFDGVGLVDSQMMNRDLFVTLTAAAAAALIDELAPVPFDLVCHV